MLGLQQQVQALRAEIDRLHERDDREMRDKEVRLEEAQQRIDDLRAVVNSLTEKCVAGKEQVRILTLQMNLQANEAVVVHKQTSHPKMGAASVLNGCPKMEEAKGGICLLIIDPQVDFHEDGALQVIGAGADSTRIKSILEKDGDKIDRVVVTLDTHHRMHIAHGCFWTNAEGESPKDFTKITAAEVESGKWTARQPEMREWALTYCKRLEEGDHFTHTIWPEHCLLGDPGHAVSPILLPALLNWSKTRERSITWVLKGQNNRTEMYSALKAEAPKACGSRGAPHGGGPPKHLGSFGRGRAEGGPRLGSAPPVSPSGERAQSAAGASRPLVFPCRCRWTTTPRPSSTWT